MTSFTHYRSHIVTRFVVLILSAILLALSNCQPNPPTPVPPEPQPAGETPTEPSPPPATADLLLGEVHLEPNNDPYFNYQIVATIVNEGAGTASGFSAGCTYECPPGEQTTSAGLGIVQGGHIAGKSRFTYKTPFHYMCAARPPTINLMCTITPAGGVAKTYSVNVTLP